MPPKQWCRSTDCFIFENLNAPDPGTLGSRGCGYAFGNTLGHALADEVPAVPFEELSSKAASGTSSSQMRADVERARNIQAERFAAGPSGVRYNAQMTSRQVREYCALDESCQRMLRHSVEEMGLSARAHDKILRVSRTIADIAGDQDISQIHLAEAINYRNLDRDLWV